MWPVVEVSFVDEASTIVPPFRVITTSSVSPDTTSSGVGLTNAIVAELIE